MPLSRILHPFHLRSRPKATLSNGNGYSKSKVPGNESGQDGSGGKADENATLTPAERAAFEKGPNLPYKDVELDDAEDKMSKAASRITQNQTTISIVAEPIGDLLETTGAVDAIESGIHQLAEGIPVLMNALDAVATIHPFVGVAVLAFKAVYTLEMKRRDNDKKIIALYVEMKDMMSALVQLKDVRDVTQTASDGSTIEGRMQALCSSTATDIKKCSNTCDAYSRKRRLVKVLKGPIWEGRLASFVSQFTKRRSEFEFALNIHAAVGIDFANRTLMDVERTTKEANERMKLLLETFQAFIPPDQIELKARVMKKGDLKTVQEDDDILADLLQDKDVALESRFHEATRTADKTCDLMDLKQDLTDDLDTVLDRNMKVFERKFEMQKQHIVDEVEMIVERQGDRIIAAVTSGPHERILDPDIHNIWWEMGWKGNVKARHFILSLRDYYMEQKDNYQRKNRNPSPTSARGSVMMDEWALAFLDVQYLQPIQEAFDDDASGYITVAEVNKFTTSRLLNWSLLHWIAYWAIGINILMVEQANRIREMFDQMFSLLPKLLPENRASASLYLRTVWRKVTTITASLQQWPVTDSVRRKFKGYMKQEMQRIRGNLENVNYDIDEMDTLSLVTGPGRIEKTVLPLIRLLLERHLRIFYIALSQVLNRQELPDAADSLVWVNDAMRYRWNDLKLNPVHRSLGLPEFFKRFSFGVFEFFNDPSLQWSSKIIRDLDYIAAPFDISQIPNENDTTILLYEPQTRIVLDTSGYEMNPNEVTRPHMRMCPQTSSQFSVLGIA